MDRFTVGSLVIGVFKNELTALQHQRPAERDSLTSAHANARYTVAEPDGGDRSRLILDGCLEFLEPKRQAFNFQSLEGTDDRAFGLKKQFGDRLRSLKSLVPQWKVKQQVSDGMNAESAVQACAHRAHAFEGFDACRQRYSCGWGDNSGPRWRRRARFRGCGWRTQEL